MNKLTKDIIEYGIEKKYKFIYKLPAINSKGKNDYINMHVDAKDVNIDLIQNYVKDHVENTEDKIIILNLKKYKYIFNLMECKRIVYY